MIGQPSKLLTARRQVVAFAGRKDILAAVERWRDGPPQRAAWLIHAPGGQGKTRLAAQVADLALAAGWTVGYARHRVETPTDGHELDPDEHARLLLIIDYAERWPQRDLQQVLGRYALHAGRVRILLLARSIGWWSAVNSVCDDLDIDTSEDPYELGPLGASIADRAVLFDAACRRFAEIYRHSYPDLDQSGPWIAPGRLSDRVYELTLGLHMAALAVVDAAARGEDPPGGSADLSRYLLDRERRYWTRLHGEAVTTTAARIVFIAALAGSQQPDEGRALLTRTGLDTDAGASAQHLLDLHARCYPSANDTVLEPLYPDRLAEDFIAMTLPGARRNSHTDLWAADLVTTQHVDDEHVTRLRPGPLFARDQHQRLPAYTGRALAFLAAAAGRHPHVADRLRALLGADPALAIDSGGNALLAVTPHTDEALACAIMTRLPERNIDLDPAAAELVSHLVALTPAADHAEHAQLQAILAIRLGNAGRREEALAPAEEAVGIYRRLVEVSPAAYLPDFAMSLNNLGMFLSALGRREEALAPAEEAAGIYRRLAEANPAAYLPNLATSLWAFAEICVKTNSGFPDALDAVTEAIDLFTRLTERLPQAFGERLWSAHLTLADVLDGLGRTDEAAELRSQLAAAAGE